MRNYLLILIILMLTGCKTHQPVLPVTVKMVERKVTTMVPVCIPGDSAVLRAWFECDSLNNVLMKRFDEQKSKNMASDFSFTGGMLEYGTKTQPDTVYLPSDSIIVEKEIPVLVPVEIEINVLTKWQNIRIRICDLIMVSLFVFVVWKLIKLYLKTKKL